MAGILNVRVVSPEQVVFEGTATSVVVPAWDGMLGVLPGHAPLVSLLGKGELTIRVAVDQVERFQIAQGVLKVEADEVTVLAEYAGRAPAPSDFRGMIPTPDRDGGDEDRRFEGISTPGNPLV